MLQQVIKDRRNKKAVSAIIGYVLLVAFAITMGGLIYNWMKSYVPKDALQCPDGVSMFIKDINLDCASNELTITFKNNGRFDIAGYFIRGAKEGEEVATIDLSSKAIGSKILVGNALLFFQGTENNFEPGKEIIGNKFDLTVDATEKQIKMIEIIPMRYEVIENKMRSVTCSNARIKEVVPACSSGGECSPDCAGKNCGDDGCGGSCGICGAGLACNSNGICIGGI
jgi:hypothetical protein